MSIFETIDGLEVWLLFVYRKKGEMYERVALGGALNAKLPAPRFAELKP